CGGCQRAHRVEDCLSASEQKRWNAAILAERHSYLKLGPVGQPKNTGPEVRLCLTSPIVGRPFSNLAPILSWNKPMSRTIITAAAAPAAPPSYSQAIKSGELVFVSGTAPIDPSTGQLVKGSVQVQVAQCLRNISAI